MSLRGWIGRSLRIGVNGSVLAAVRAKSVTYAAAPIDLSEGERNGFRRLAREADTRTVDVQVDGVCSIDNWPVLRDEWHGETLTSVSIQHPDGSVTTADAFLSALSRTGESGGAVSFSATFQLSGIVEGGSFLTTEVYPNVVPPQPDPGIDAGALTLGAGENEETVIIGYSAFGTLVEGGCGSIDPEFEFFGGFDNDQYRLTAVADIFDTENSTGITDHDLFVVKAADAIGEDGPPPADSWVTLFINDKTYNTFECADEGTFTGFTPTAGTATQGNSRFWWWPLQAGFVDGVHYPFQ